MSERMPEHEVQHAINRVHTYLEALATGTGLDKEVIHSFNMAPLLRADVEELLQIALDSL